MVATDGTWRESNVADQGRAAIAPALAVSLAFALGVGVFLFTRRMVGAFETPLAPLPLLFTAVGLLMWIAAVRLYLGDRRIDWLTALVLALFAVACSYPGQHAFDWLVWLAATALFAALPGRCVIRSVKSDFPAEDLLQQLTRSRAADGSEAIHGTLLAEFAAGERTLVLHVAFCPPFERPPTVEAEVADGPECTVKVSQILHQGARLEVRLARASTTSERATIEFAASDRPPLAD